MSREHWARVSELFAAALERQPGERRAFVEQACGNDTALCDEVLSLLASHAGSGTFLDNLFADGAMELLADIEPPAVPDGGRRIGSYVIRREIGRGGMGVVYLAEDTRLGRPVAIKAVRPQAAGDPQRRERLRREARAAASLAHPGIATIHALEEIGDELYMVSEYVAGRTLRAELDDGPLPSGRLLDTAIELAGAVAFAHEHGVTHRDLKPENVVRTPDGHIKVLDFGLARQETPQPGGLAATRLTQPGIIIGTPEYMSPEQLQRGAIDHRTDVFALGVVLYEMAAGSHPFRGRDPLSTMARILEGEPAPLDAGGLPAGLERIVRRCLQKEPAARYPSAADLAADLKRLRAAAPLPAGAGVPRASSSRLRWWRLHQVSVTLVYAVMAVPVWMTRDWSDGRIGRWLFFALAAAAVAGGTLRLHLLFVEAAHPATLRSEIARSRPWLRLADWAYAVLLLVGAVAIAGGHPEWAALLGGAAVGLLLAHHVIEPSTTEAAFAAHEAGRDNQ